MKQGLTLKLQIDVSQAQEAPLIELQEQYRKTCQFVSDYYFGQRFESSRYQLHDVLYQTIRSDFSLKVPQAQSVLITVLARYKTVEMQLKKKCFYYQDQYTDQWHAVKKDIN